MKDKVILGGTFDHIHIGHMKLIDKALQEGEVTIGLVSDEMLKTWKPEVERSFDERKVDLENYLSKRGDWKIIEISDPYTKAVEGEYEKLVVSSETRERGEMINEKRIKKGKEPLEIIEIEPVVAEDFLPISSTRIRDGEINEYGDRLKPVKFYLRCFYDKEYNIIQGTLSKFFDCEFERKTIDEKEFKQYNNKIDDGAKKLVELPEGFDYGLVLLPSSVEIGEDRLFFEYAVMKDKLGFISEGRSPVIRIPFNWIKANEGLQSMGSFKMITETKDEGIDPIKVISDGNEGKKGYIRSALTEVLLPRMNGELYR